MQLISKYLLMITNLSKRIVHSSMDNFRQQIDWIEKEREREREKERESNFISVANRYIKEMVLSGLLLVSY